VNARVVGAIARGVTRIRFFTRPKTARPSRHVSRALFSETRASRRSPVGSRLDRLDDSTLT
jgi:hypothetical protein